MTTSTYWPCYCIVQRYVVIHFCDSMWFVRVESYLRWICFYHLFISVFPLEIQVSLTALTPPHFYSCPGLDFQRHMSWSFLSSMIWGERWLLVLLIWPLGGIDDHHCIERWLLVLLIWPIGGIDDHHCINFLFITF